MTDTNYTADDWAKEEGFKDAESLETWRKEIREALAYTILCFPSKDAVDRLTKDFTSVLTGYFETEDGKVVVNMELNFGKQG